jgi:hypothetical protein
MTCSSSSAVIPGLVPGIHALRIHNADKDVGGRDKPGHDDGETCRGSSKGRAH